MEDIEIMRPDKGGWSSRWNACLVRSNQPPVVSLGWLSVMVVAKRRQRENRECDWASKFWHLEGWRSNFDGKQYKSIRIGEKWFASAGSKSTLCFTLWLFSQLGRTYCFLPLQVANNCKTGECQKNSRQSDSFIVLKKLGNANGGKWAT